MHRHQSNNVYLQAGNISSVANGRIRGPCGMVKLYSTRRAVNNARPPETNRSDLRSLPIC